ncbi:MAG: hypothetical protein ABI158_02925, partial [Edaphobacter sp.]
GLNPSISTGFALSNSSTCPQLSTSSSAATLAAGTSCTLLVSFNPVAVGSNSGSLVLTDNHLNITPSTTQTIALNGTGQLATPILAFATIPSHTYGDAPFTVSATSASSGVVTYSVASGPATITGNTVTLTGAGTVVLSASQAATATYSTATATTSFTVAAGVLDFTMAGVGPMSKPIAKGGTITFTFSIAPTNGVYPGPVTFNTISPDNSIPWMISFSPPTLAANSGAQTVTMTVTRPLFAKLDMPASHRSGYIAFAILFLPLFGTRRLRRVARKLGRGTSIALLLLITLSAAVGLNGCSKDPSIQVNATSGGMQHFINVSAVPQ